MIRRVEIALKEDWLFFLLLFTAGALRFYQVEQTPFHNDELSALSRLKFESLSEIILKGVQPDGHPAFTQIFLHFWGKIFGESHLITRLPFIMSGLGSIAILFQLQKEIFGRAAAYLAVAFLAVGQLFIFDSTMARPYAFGLLFTSGFAYVIYKIYKADNPSTSNFVLAGVLLAMTAYVHYFAALTATFIYLSGFFFVKRALWLKYFLTGVLSLFLFSPHFGITMAQLSIGGIGGPGGWLAPPEPTAFFRFLLSAVNGSYFILCVLFLGVLIGGIYAVLSKKYFGLNFIFWPISTYLIGFYYSVHVNPVMHEQTMVFAIQFFVLAASAAFQTNNRAVMVGLPIVVAAIGMFNLQVERQHYEVMKSTPFAWLGKEFDNSMLVSAQTNYDYINYYASSFPDSQKHTLTGLNKDSMAKQIENSSASAYLGDGLNYTAEVLAAKKYPHIKQQKNGFTYTGYVREKGVANSEEYGDFIFNKDYDGSDSSEYLNLFNGNLSDGWNISSEFIAHLEFESKPPDNLVLVVEVNKEKERVLWQGSKAISQAVQFGNKYILVNGALLWNSMTYPREIEGAELFVYIWNSKKEPFTLRYAEIYRRNPNPNRYGLLLPRP
ncbi:MAG: glycosyltransferase family 39 protein [Bacteroidota bacterium]